jgi:hypothetical protein
MSARHAHPPPDDRDDAGPALPLASAGWDDRFSELLRGLLVSDPDRLPPDRPTEHLPGSAGKVEAMRERRAARRALQHDADVIAESVDDHGFVVRRLRNGATVITGVSVQRGAANEEDEDEDLIRLEESPGVLLSYSRRGLRYRLVREGARLLVVREGRDPASERQVNDDLPTQGAG